MDLCDSGKSAMREYSLNFGVCSLYPQQAVGGKAAAGCRSPRRAKPGKGALGGGGVIPRVWWVDALCNFVLDGGFYGFAVFGVGHAEPGFFGGNDLEDGLGVTGVSQQTFTQNMGVYYIIPINLRGRSADPGPLFTVGIRRN